MTSKTISRITANEGIAAIKAMYMSSWEPKATGAMLPHCQDLQLTLNVEDIKEVLGETNEI